MDSDDLHGWTPLDSTDVCRETTDQKDAGGNADHAEHLERVPHAKALGGHSRSLTGSRPPSTWSVVVAAHPISQATELPSWSCGFDSRHLLPQVRATFSALQERRKTSAGPHGPYH